jgi:predicted RNA binding protein YcfA (HicA-like mRNA interferase family)
VSRVDLRRLLRTVRAKGWTVGRTASGHLRLIHPNGAIIVAGGTSSDRRAGLNLQADLRRAERSELE